MFFRDFPEAAHHGDPTELIVGRSKAAVGFEGLLEVPFSFIDLATLEIFDTELVLAEGFGVGFAFGADFVGRAGGEKKKEGEKTREKKGRLEKTHKKPRQRKG